MKKLLLSIAIVATLAASLPSAYAVATLRLTHVESALVVTITDGNSDGMISFTGTVGIWSVSTTATALTMPAVGSATSPSMDVNSGTTLSSSGAGTLKIEFSEVGFGTTPAGTFKADIDGNYGGGTVTYDTYQALALFGTVNPLTSISGTGTDYQAVGPLANPYSLTQVITIFRTGAGATAFDASLVFVGVPDGGSTLLLLGSAMGALCFVGWRRKN